MDRQSNKLRELHSRLQDIHDAVYRDPAVVAAVNAAEARSAAEVRKIHREIQEEINRLDAQHEARRLTARWPAGTPEDVLELCRRYWQGTSEYRVFRIHEYNDIAVWTSYPSGGYSDNSGWHRTPSGYRLLFRKVSPDRHGRIPEVRGTDVGIAGDHGIVTLEGREGANARTRMAMLLKVKEPQ